MEKNFKKACLAIILAGFIFSVRVLAISTVISQTVPTIPGSASSTSGPVIKYMEPTESGGASVIFAPPQTSAEQIQSKVGSTIKGGISTVITVPTESPGVVSSVFMRAVSGLEVKPTEIFTSVLSEATNITVNAEIKDNKVVYSLEAPTNTPIVKNPAATEAKPLFDLKIEAPVEFKLENNEVIINNEQSVNYGEVKSAFSGGGSMPLAKYSFGII